MSLQVWLPLTGDLHNQGLSGVAPTNNGATVDSSGKLGKCYSFNNSAIGIGATNITLGTTFSIVCWIKINSYNADWANAFKIYKDSYDYIGLCMNQTSASTKQLGFHIYKNNGSNVRTGVSDAYYMPLTIGTWYHLCFVVTPSEVKTYQNGVNIRTSSITTTFPSVSNYNLGLGRSSLFGGLDCSMNDFRLYNDALSESEIKELARGLVLHYPLNRNGWGQENLIVTNSMAPISGTSGWSRAGTGWVNSNVVSAGASNGHAIRCTYSGTTQTSGGIHHGTGVDKTVLINGATYTVSARIRASKACIATFDNELMTTTNRINLTTDWKIYSYSCAIDNTKTYQSNVIYCIPADVTQNMWIECDWIKLEEGSIATPWCPNSSDPLATTMGLNGTTEYDISGLQNNGTKIGTFTYISDTPKYDVCANFNGTDNAIIIPFDATVWQTNFTMNIWFKKDALGTKNYETLIGGPSGFEMDTRANNATTLSLYMASVRGGNLYSPFEFGTWYMVTLVNDGTNEYYYVNGELVKTIEKKSMPTGTYYIGAWQTEVKQNYYGLMSDFRIYATALSAEDIAQLYSENKLT